MPGEFPEELLEAPVPSNRNPFNSNNLQQVAVRLGRWIQYLIIQPLIVILVLAFGLFSKIVSLIYYTSSHLNSQNLNLSADPIDRATKFVCSLEESLTPELQHSHLSNNGVARLPPFYKGSYTQALYMANNRAKFLYVYITNQQNENSSAIFEQIITNPRFISIFRDPNTMIWGGDITNSEAYQLANSLNVTKLPFVGLLCLSRSSTMTPQGSVKTPAKISLVLKIQGGISSHTTGDINSLIDAKFIKRMAKYEPELALIRSELRSKFVSKVLLRQQDLNYQTSLARDRKKKEERLAKKKGDEYIKSKIPYYSEMLRVSLAATSAGTSSQNKARLAIKLPSGERKKVLFPADKDVGEIFEFVELLKEGRLQESLLEQYPVDQGSFGGNFESVSDNFTGNLTFSFKLVSPLPPRVVLNDYLGQSTIIRDIPSIYPNGMLIIEESL